MKSYTQYIKEDLDAIWKNGIDKIDGDISGKISVFLKKLEQTKEIKNVINGFEDFISDIITEYENKITTNIPKEDIEDSEKIKKIGQELFSVLSSIYIVLSKISVRFEDVYSPNNLFNDAKTPVNDIMSVDEVTFEKNIENNIIKLLTKWGQDIGLSTDGINKIKNFKLFEAESVNVPITDIGEKSLEMLKYLREHVIKKINSM